jgi:YD repeat-containing protein
MKNIQGTKKKLKLYYKNGKLAYWFHKGSYCTIPSESTYDKNGKQLTFKNSDGYSYEYTYDKNGNRLTFKDSNDYSWERTYDKQGNELTFKNSDGVMRGLYIKK